jgi:ELWxxDGT repeat protein
MALEFLSPGKIPIKGDSPIMRTLRTFSRFISTGALLIGTIMPAAQAQLATRVEDINTSSGDAFDKRLLNLGPLEFVTVNGVVYFRAITGEGSTVPNTPGQLWRTDGTPEGTMRVKDIDPIAGGAFSNSLAAVGDTLFVLAIGLNGPELWKSDGTEAGTTRVKVLRADTIVGSLGNELLLGVENQLWKSNGTEAGTVFVKDVRPSKATAVGSTLFFAGSQTSTGVELWKTDGTPAGTVMVKDTNPGPSSGVTIPSPPLAPPPIVVVGNTLFFTATAPDTGRELWKSDGTEAGTVLVKDIVPGIPRSVFAEQTAVGMTLAFVAREPEGGSELWKSDGTAAGTVRVRDIVPGAGSSDPKHLAVIGSTLYFQAFEPNVGVELWKSDGSEAGTVLVKDIEPGTGSSAPMALAALGDMLVFAAADSETGSELWKSDGTAGGTVRVKDIVPGVASSTPLDIYEADGAVLFAAFTPEAGIELWRSDGTEQGTMIVKDINLSSGGSSPTELTPVGDILFFQALDPKTGLELWKSDGTGGGTVLVKDINPGPPGSMPYDLTALGNMLFFFAQEPNTGIELWKSDGTPEGTTLVKEIARSDAIPPSNLTVMDNMLFFFVSQPGGNGATGSELWKSDGTEEGTVLVHQIPDYYPSDMTRVGSTLFFTAGLHPFSRHMYKTDGTPGGLLPVGAVVLALGNLTPTSSLLFFTGWHGPSGQGYELWRSDGTPQGTYAIPGIPRGPSPISPTAVGDTVFFTRFDETTGGELWKTDGTAAGTTRIKVIPDDQSPFVSFHVAVDDVLFFNVCQPASGCELWKSDGTEAGTVLVRDINPGPGSSAASLTLTSAPQAADLAGVLSFAADDGFSGIEPWRSGGTPETTFGLSDIAPVSRSSSPDSFTLVNENVFFTADDGATGRELWVLPASAGDFIATGEEKRSKKAKKHTQQHSRSRDHDGSEGRKNLESIIHQIAN